MIVVYLVAAAAVIDLASRVAEAVWRLATATATAHPPALLCAAAPDVDAPPSATATATATNAPARDRAPRRRRVTLAVHPQAHDALSQVRRAALHKLPLGWYVQGRRVETAAAVEVGGELHRAVMALLGRPNVADIPEGSARCWACGCVEVYACPGGCAWWRPSWCTACARRTATVPRRELAGGALAQPDATARRAPSLDDEERAEREGAPEAARRWGRRRAPVAADALGLRSALPSPAAEARGRVLRQLEPVVLPALRERALPVASVVVLLGFGRDVSAALAAPLDVDPDALACVALERAEEVYARLPSGAARRLAGELRRHPRAGLCALWVAAGRVDLVHLAHVDDAAVAGRRAS